MDLDAYLIPKVPPVSPTKYAALAKRVLLGMDVISGGRYGDEVDYWWQGGEASPFENEGGFEWVEIYGKSKVELVPSSGSVQPRCPACKFKMSEPYYAAVNDYEELDAKPGYLKVKVVCPACQRRFRLNELASTPPVYLIRCFVGFMTTEESIDPDWLKEFNKEMKIPHVALDYDS